MLWARNDEKEARNNERAISLQQRLQSLEDIHLKGRCVEEHNGVYASTAGDSSGGKGERGYVSTTFQPGRTTAKK